MIPHVYTEKKEEEQEIEYDFKQEKKIEWYDRVLLNRPSKVIAVWILIGLIAPILIYRYLFFTSADRPPSDGFSIGSCLVPREARLPCGIGNSSENECHAQCCFDHGNNFCFHRLPSRFSYIIDREWNDEVVLQPRISTVPYASQSSKTNLRLAIDELSATHLALSFYHSPDNSLTGKKTENKTYMYTVTSPEVNVIVNSTQGTIFNMARGPLIASNNIWEITFKLTNESMFGLGELPLKLGTTKVFYNHKGGLTSMPLIFAKANGSYHGVLIDGTSPTEVSILGNNNVVVRSITNAGLRLHVFVGPRPKDVMNDAMTVMEAKTKLEYWMLGAHICSEITDTPADALEYLRSFLTNATREEIPFESHCGTAPLLFNANECDVDTTEFIQRGIQLLKENQKRFVPHISPYIKYDRNLTENNESDEDSPAEEICYKMVSNYKELFYRHPETFDIYQGLVEDCTVLYLNYENASVDFMKELWVNNDTLDGVILENSWPLDQTNKTHNETEIYLPYFNENFAAAFDETPPWDLKLLNNNESYFQNHNRYGNNFAKAFQDMFDKAVPTWSSSNWMKADIAVNRQEIDASWTNLHKELVEAALGGISGHWLWSSPICGDTENFDPINQASLCVKWYMTGTFFPMLKIHSKIVPRTPSYFLGAHKNLMIQALQRRLSLLPYLYTTLQEGPILRPMFYQFPTVDNLTDINTQFSVGDDLVIVPNLQPLQSHVRFWLPPGSWYEFFSGLRLEGEVGEILMMSTTESDFFSVIRGGSIIVTQKNTRVTAEETRLLSPMSITIALECQNNGSQCNAAGKLFVADNMTIHFEATENKVVINIQGQDTSLFCDPSRAILASTITEIAVFGLKEEFNNYDHQKQIQTTINLCNLGNNEIPLS